MPESSRHLELRTLLYLLLKRELEGRAVVGSDAFVYWDATDSHKRLAPDVFAAFRDPTGDYPSWKTWELGSIDLAVEILSPSDAATVEWQAKLARYRELGVRELVAFNAAGPHPLDEGLRIYDSLDGVLTERELTPGEPALSTTLGLYWCIAPADDQPSALRLAYDPEGRELVPTDREARLAETEARLAAEAARQREAEARQAEAEARLTAEARAREAERRVEELEELLRRRDER